MDEKIVLVSNKNAKYVSKTEGFGPSDNYPEIRGCCCNAKNDLYGMVRELFHLYGLDKENYGTCEWNPLGEIIKKNNTVLIKPNLVMDVNPVGNLDCLYTNPSVVAPIIDYVIKALDGTGKIIVGDAPLQECNFEKLINQSGYKELVDYYKEKGINIELKDFRNTKTYVKDGMHFSQNPEAVNDNGILVSLNEDSAFSDLDEEKISDLRVTNYDPYLMNKHHKKNIHEYMIAKDMLCADVVINMPKAKTHRIAGVTISMKNLIGINANKELLPHHRLGSKEEGGDAYQHKSDTLRFANDLKDKVNELNAHNRQHEAIEVEEHFKEVLNKGLAENREKYWNGFWYGNDTIWRTIVDLNRIFLYADKTGVVQNEPQRKMIIIGDMIVAGEKEGPLNPSPIYCGTLSMGTNPVLFDRTICSLMGFDWRLFPTFNNKYLSTLSKSLLATDIPTIISNNVEWNLRELDEIRDSGYFSFEPTEGWRNLLPSRMRNESLGKLQTGEAIYIFGAGKIGHSAYYRLSEYNITVTAFVDNDKAKHNKIIIDDITCIAPAEVPKKAICIIAVGNKYVDEIDEEIKQLNIKHVYKWSEIII